MKTTVEIPDVLFRRAKSRAAERGQTLKEFLTEAVQEKLAPKSGPPRQRQPEWMAGFGKLRRLRKASDGIRQRVHEAFETVEPEDRA